MKEHGWGRPKTPKIIRILTCTPAHRRSQVMQTYEHMNIPRSKAERDRHALNAQRRRVRVRPIARSSSRALRRCAQLAQRPETRRYRRWRPPVQASSTAPVNGVACGMLAGGRGGRGSEARTLPQNYLASLLPPRARLQSGALAHLGDDIVTILGTITRQRARSAQARGLQQRPRAERLPRPYCAPRRAYSLRSLGPALNGQRARAEQRTN